MIAALLILWLHGATSFTATTTSTRPCRQPTTTASSSSSTHCDVTSSALRSAHGNNEELHLLTFDLDDTIFPIGPVVADANEAQLRTLVRFGYVDASNEEIIAASKRIRTELREAGGEDVITYTELRKRSIRREIERVLLLTGPAAGGGVVPAAAEVLIHDSVIDQIFDAWLSERHASADRNLFPHASSALERIRDEHPNAVIAAITNGRGNPLEMPTVCHHFDFCVSGEDDGVFPRRKPDAGIYRAAVNRYKELRAGEEEESMMEQRTGGGGDHDVDFTWIHVGDDLANDVGAGAACGAKSIWFTVTQDDDESTKLPSWSTATEEELQKRAAMDEMARGHVSAKISSLEELPGAIMDILNQ